MHGVFDQVIEEIKKGQSFLVASHKNPEGDAVGSTLGLSLALRMLGKDVTPYLEDLVPEAYKFLPGAELVTDEIDVEGRYDVIIAVDCGQGDRIGDRFDRMAKEGIVINIDHHATNNHFGNINIVDPAASSAGELVYDLIKYYPIEITKEIATNLYVAILTDTGSFRYSSATPEAFKKAGELVAMGVEPWHVSQQIFECYPARRLKLLAKVLDTLEITRDGKIALLTVTRDMLNNLQAGYDLADGFVNYGRSIEGVEVALLITELGGDGYKVSFRSKGDVNVAEIALNFGGGGHANAAGCKIKGRFGEVKERLIEVAEEAVKGLK